MQLNNTICSCAKPTNIPEVITDFLQAFRLYASEKVLDIILTYINKEATRAFVEKQTVSIDEDGNCAK